MRPIPAPLRANLEKEKRMKYCAVWGLGFGFCEGRLEWHHPWTYAGRQINELWSIIAVCHRHHAKLEGNVVLKRKIESISLSLATPEDLQKYPNKNWQYEISRHT